MAIRLSCSCGQRLAVADRLVGRTISCPKCDSAVSVKKEKSNTGSSYIRFRCKCGRKMKAPLAWAGKKSKCPKCEVPFRIPRPKSPSDTVSLKSSATDTVVDLPDAASDLSGLLDEIGANEIRTGRRCGNCSTEMPMDAVLCIECGWDRRTNAVRETQHGAGGSSIISSVRELFRE